MPTDYEQYTSPSTERYGSEVMRGIWSEKQRRKLWRKVWLELARAQCPVLVSEEEFQVIASRAGDVFVEDSLDEEIRTKHDVAAELRVFERQVGPAGCKLHLGATSSDIVENARSMQIKLAMDRLADRISVVCDRLEHLASRLDNQKCIGRTHLQPADPLYWYQRINAWKYPLDHVWTQLTFWKASGKGFKGAVGAYTGYLWAYQSVGINETQALEHVAIMEADAMSQLGLETQEWTTQVGDRTDELQLAGTLNALAAALHKLHQDIRLLRMSGELEEQKSEGQVGSSAMPHKNNPIISENVCSLARMVPALTGVLWDNAATSMLERSLDDSANTRYVWPEVFILLDHMLGQTAKLLPRLRVTDTSKQLVKRHLWESLQSEMLVLARMQGSTMDAQGLIKTVTDINQLPKVCDELGLVAQHFFDRIEQYSQ